jgi:hypothetical protein
MLIIIINNVPPSFAENTKKRLKQNTISGVFSECSAGRRGALETSLDRHPEASGEQIPLM